MILRLCVLLSIAISANSFAAKPVKPAAKTAEECSEDETQKLAGAVMGAVSKIKGCPNVAKLATICDSLASRIGDSKPDSPYQFLYQRKIYEAACADPAKDSPEEVKAKVQAMWAAAEDKLVCDSSNFEVGNGNILKYAMALKIYSFIDEAVKKWGVNLNRIDPVDNRTLLDYVEMLQARYKGSEEEYIIGIYYKKLVKAGAKSKTQVLAELKSKANNA